MSSLKALTQASSETKTGRCGVSLIRTLRHSRTMTLSMQEKNHMIRIVKCLTVLSCSSAIQAWTPKPTLCSSISQYHQLSKSFYFPQTDHQFRCRLAVVLSDSKSLTIIANTSDSGKDEIQIDFGGGGGENFGGGGGDDQNDRGDGNKKKQK
ncbi:hypothetical protein QYF36_027082 [Acer negundo]|nr:hypothetical protein QYF36_027082 [Acer negundo]